MSGVFASEELIEIVIKYVQTDGNKAPIIVSTEEGEKKHGDKVKSIKTFWKTLDWKSANDMTRESMTYNTVTGEPSLDVFKLRELRMKKCLKKWDLKDATNQPIPCNEQYIDKLHPAMAGWLIESYNDITIPDDEDQKN